MKLFQGIGIARNVNRPEPLSSKMALYRTSEKNVKDKLNKSINYPRIGMKAENHRERKFNNSHISRT